ncbi:MAG: hypothetical protein K4571_14885 [Deltaproteobacteria bacterium]
MHTLQNKLYKAANKIVGNIGPSTNVRDSVTGEPYITFSFITDNKEEISSTWSRWIKAYVLFKQLEKPEGKPFNKEPPLTIFWRLQPRIIESDGRIYVFARLLISRDNRNTFTCD